MRTRLTERDLSRIVKRVISEQEEGDGKKELLQVMKNYLSKFESDEWDGISVAQSIYNTCAHFMNKTDMFSSRPGTPLSSRVPFAPEE
jgi:hypothetical protein